MDSQGGGMGEHLAASVGSWLGWRMQWKWHCMDVQVLSSGLMQQHISAWWRPDLQAHTCIQAAVPAGQVPPRSHRLAQAAPERRLHACMPVSPGCGQAWPGAGHLTRVTYHSMTQASMDFC